jgi:hypothetical protein
MGLAREIVAAGHPDQPWRSIARNGAALLSGPSIYRLAMLTVSENASHGPRVVRYEDFSHLRKARNGYTKATQGVEKVS